jgi:hypothetical protein
VTHWSPFLRQRARWSEGHLRAAVSYAWPILKAPGLSPVLKLDLLGCLASIYLPLTVLPGLAAGTLAARGFFSDGPVAGLHSAESALLFLLMAAAAGLASWRVEGRWRWRPAVSYMALIPLLMLAVGRALLMLAVGGSQQWDKTSRAAIAQEVRP